MIAAAASLALAVAVWAQVFRDTSDLCEQVLEVLEYSATDFADILGDASEHPGEDGVFGVGLQLNGSDRCEITVDPERASYLCDWAFAAGDDGASSLYSRSVDELRSCLVASAVERRDALVNHPDFFESTYFELPDEEVSISLKNKNAQQKTYVSVGVDHVN